MLRSAARPATWARPGIARRRSGRLLPACATLLALLVAAMGAGPAVRAGALAQELTLSPIGQLGGAVQAVAAVGTTTYLGVGPRLLILDACDPYWPLMLGQTEPLPGIVSSVAVSEGYAYVAASADGLVVVDVRDPARPQIVGHLAMNGSAARMVLAEGLLYAAAGAGGLHIIDIHVPTDPRLLGTFTKIVTDVAVKNEIAFVVARDLMVVDVSDPAAPRQVGALETWSEVIEVAGDFLYAGLSDPEAGTEREGYLQVYDVTNPRRARRLGRMSLGAVARDLTVDGTRAYALSGNTVRVIEAQDPNRPVVLGAVGVPESSLRLAPGGRFVYVAAVGAGLRAIDLANPAAPREGSSWATLGSAEAAVAARGFVYVEDEGAGDRLVAVDVRDPEHPRLRGAVNIGVASESLAVLGEHLYVGAPDSTLRVIDISRPEQPRLIATLPLPEPVWSVAGQGDYVYVANDEHLRVVDVHDPASPHVVGSSATIGGATDLALEHPFAYIAGPATGLQLSQPSLQVIDVSNPSFPRQGGFTSAASSNGGLAVGAGHAFIGGLQVIDVRDPGIPREVARLGRPRDSRNNALSDSYLYVAQRQAGLHGRLQVYGVGSPQRPTEAAGLDLADEAQDVAVEDRTAYIAVHLAGLVVVRLQGNLPPPPPTPTPTIQPDLPQHAYLPLAARGPVGPACR